jgi:hypothetical protein
VSDIHARLLLAHLRTDPVIGVAHSQWMPAAAPGAELLVLEPGSVSWVHGRVSPASMASLGRAEVDLMASVAPANVNGGH